MAKKEKKNKISNIAEETKETDLQNELSKETKSVKTQGPSKPNNLRAILLIILACFLMICFCFISYKVFFGTSDLYSSTDSININGLEKLDIPDSSIMEKSPGL
jgi:hypothetical protein